MYKAQAKIIESNVRESVEMDVRKLAKVLARKDVESLEFITGGNLPVIAATVTGALPVTSFVDLVQGLINANEAMMRD